MKTKALFFGVLFALGVGCKVKNPSGKVKDTAIGAELGLEKGACYFRGKMEMAEYGDNIGGWRNTSYVNVMLTARGGNPGDYVFVTVYSNKHCSRFEGQLDSKGELSADRGDVEFGKSKGDGYTLDASFDYMADEQRLIFRIHGLIEGETKDTELRGACASDSYTVTKEEPRRLDELDCHIYDLNDKGDWKYGHTVRISVPKVDGDD